MLKRFLSYYKPHKKIFILDMLASLAVSTIGILYPIITRSMINDLIPNKKYDVLILSGVALLVVYLVASCFGVLFYHPLLSLGVDDIAFGLEHGEVSHAFGSGLGVETTALTSEDVLAATFNKQLVYDMGNIVGNDCLAAKVAILYGPGANTHRTPYGGRNFEYYSEDGYLSSAIGAAEVKGIEDKGVHVVIKHFALNDCEQDRIGLGVWLNEQSAREIYLKAFQGALEASQAGGNGVMMAYTRWGTRWSGSNYNLVTGIMKNEWGCHGLQITDNVLTTYVNGVDGVMAGTTAYDSMMAFYITDQLPLYENDPVVVSAMKEACHQNLWAIAHSCGMNGVGKDTVIKATEPQLLATIRTVMICVLVVCVASLALWIFKRITFKKSEAYVTYHQAKKK